MRRIVILAALVAAVAGCGEKVEPTASTKTAKEPFTVLLDYVPNGTPIHPIVRIGRHAAEGIIEASAEQEADLIIFGWGGKAPASSNGRNGGPTVFSPTIDEVVRESPCDIAVVKQRGSLKIERVLYQPEAAGDFHL